MKVNYYCIKYLSDIQLVTIVCLSNIRFFFLVKTVLDQAYIWAMWGGKNDNLFNNVVFNPLSTSKKIQYLVFRWLHARSPLGMCLNWLEWCCNLSLLFLYFGLAPC